MSFSTLSIKSLLIYNRNKEAKLFKEGFTNGTLSFLIVEMCTSREGHTALCTCLRKHSPGLFIVPFAFHKKEKAVPDIMVSSSIKERLQGFLGSEEVFRVSHGGLCRKGLWKHWPGLTFPSILILIL